MTIRCTLVLAVLAISQHANAQEMPKSAIDTSLLDRELAAQSAPITSEQDLAAYDLSVRDNPLNALPRAARREFVSSVRFRDGRVTTYKASLLERHTSPAEAYAILALFGAEHAAALLEGQKLKMKDDLFILQHQQNSFNCTSMGDCDTVKDASCAAPRGCITDIGWYCHAPSCSGDGSGS